MMHGLTHSEAAEAAEVSYREASEKAALPVDAV
jgi:hypothetical protein